MRPLLTRGWRKSDKIVVRSVSGEDAVGAPVLIGYCHQDTFENADELHWVQTLSGR
jgi:hypothetical protein